MIKFSLYLNLLCIMLLNSSELRIPVNSLMLIFHRNPNIV